MSITAYTSDSIAQANEHTLISSSMRSLTSFGMVRLGADEGRREDRDLVPGSPMYRSAQLDLSADGQMSKVEKEKVRLQLP